MAGNGGSSDRDLTSQELGADSRLCPWSCENSERASTEGNRVLLALRVPSRLATGRANIARERKIVLRVPNAPAFSHGQDPKRPWPIGPSCDAANPCGVCRELIVSRHLLGCKEGSNDDEAAGVHRARCRRGGGSVVACRQRSSWWCQRLDSLIPRRPTHSRAPWPASATA